MDDCGGQFFHGRLLVGIFETTRIVKGLVRLGNGHLMVMHMDLYVAEDRPYGDQPT